jgi:hypothetical protein
MKIVCEKHEDITENAFVVQYIDKSSGRGILKRKIYCLKCITDFLDKLNLPKVTEEKDPVSTPEN